MKRHEADEKKTGHQNSASDVSALKRSRLNQAQNSQQKNSDVRDRSIPNVTVCASEEYT